MSCRCKTHIKKVCSECGKTFEVCRYREKTAKYCSHKCASLGTSNLRHEKNQIEVICNWCNEKFTVKGYRKNTVGYCSNKCRAKHQKELFSGKNSWSWKGGLTPLKRLLRTTSDYKLWRKSVFERDNFTCQFCGEKNVFLNADHILPFAKILETKDMNKLWDIKNGRTLCVPCHKKTDTFGRRSIN